MYEEVVSLGISVVAGVENHHFAWAEKYSIILTFTLVVLTLVITFILVVLTLVMTY